LKNGIFELLSGSVSIADKFFNFHFDRTFFYEKNFLIMMCIGIIFTILSQCILLPIVFSVHRTNNKVISLFGYIHENDVKVLEKRCQTYILDHLQDENLQGIRDKDRDTQYFYDNLEETTMNNPKGPGGARQHDPEHSGQEEVRLDQQEVSPPEQVVLEGDSQHQSNANNAGTGNQGGTPNVDASMNQSMQDQAPLMTMQNNENMEKNDDEIDIEDDVDRLEERARKLTQNQRNNQRGIICRFSFICVLIVFYFLIDFYMVRKKIHETRMNYLRLKKSSDRSFLLKYVIIYTYEEIINRAPIMVKGKNFKDAFNGRKFYEEKVYTNEQEIDEVVSNKLFLRLNLGRDFCNTFYEKDKAQAKSKIILPLSPDRMLDCVSRTRG
jgi:hypothetical protein